MATASSTSPIECNARSAPGLGAAAALLVALLGGLLRLLGGREARAAVVEGPRATHVLAAQGERVDAVPVPAERPHQLADGAEGAGIDSGSVVGTLHRLAVIGLLYELGECNTFLDAFWDAFPE